MEFCLPTFAWVLSLKFEDVLFGATRDGLSCSVCHGTLGVYRLVLRTM